MRRKITTVLLLSGLAAMVVGAVMVWPAVRAILSGEGLPDTMSPAVRPVSWAQPVDLPDVENMYRIDDGLYRSAQPSEEGMGHLAEMGIRTIVNLRSVHDDADEVDDTGLRRVNIPAEPWDLDQRQVLQFLKVATDPSCRPVLVHCQQGADRTGAMAAAYRIVVEGWTKQQAIEEMTRGGFGFHRAWVGVVDFVRGLDVAELRRQLGLRAPHAEGPTQTGADAPR